MCSSRKSLSCKGKVHSGGSARGYPAGSASLTARLWRSAIVLTWIFMQRCPREERTHLPRTGSSAAGTARSLATPRSQAGTLKSASRGRGLTGKPLTESNLSLCTTAQIPAVLYRFTDLVGACAHGADQGIMRPRGTGLAGAGGGMRMVWPRRGRPADTTKAQPCRSGRPASSRG